MLGFYAQRFCAVEINNTFYRMPKSEVLRGWREQAGPEFLFTLKAPQAITHFQRLRDSAESVATFFSKATELDTQLGPVLFQLPPNFKQDLSRLKDFLGLLPKGIRVAFEFRHPSWFHDDVYQVLSSSKVALCIAEDEALATPFVATAAFGYVRLRRVGYELPELAVWARKVIDAPWDEAFVFFKHEDEAHGPKLAGRFAALLKAK
jgi:uncharacterized protein YecE (DUF72 family)